MKIELVKYIWGLHTRKNSLLLAENKSVDPRARQRSLTSAFVTNLAI